MQYDFYIETNQGVKHAIVYSLSTFSGAPFGYVPYKLNGSCELDQATIDEFWRCIDLVLQEHGLTSDNFIRAVRAYCNNGIIYGEV